MEKILKIKRKSNKTLTESITHSIVFVFFCALAFTYIYCLFFCFVSGLKTHNDVQEFPFAIPNIAQWNFGNYIEAAKLLEAKKVGFLGMIFNSIYYSTIPTFLTIFCTCFLAYTVTFYKFKGAGIYLAVTYIVMILPIYGSGGAHYKLLDDLNLVNSRLFVLTGLGGIGVDLLYFNAYYKNLSWTYGEAAAIDGASHFGIFFKIMLPQTLPIFGALYLMAWIGMWNNYATSLIYYPSMPTLSTGLFLFQQEIEVYGGRSDIFYAGCFLTSLVPLTLFAFFNKTMMSNVSLGGIKE